MKHPQLPGIFHSFLGIQIEPLLNHYGYLAVAVSLTAESFGLPLPGETMLIAASIYAGAGALNVVLVGLVAVAAAFAGDNIAFAIGHYGGSALIERYGRYFFLTEHRMEKATRFYNSYGGRIVMAARYIEGLRQVNGIIAGATGMSWRKFVVFDAIGVVSWVTVWVALGDLAGHHINTVYKILTTYVLYVVIALVVIGGLYLLRRRRKAAAARAEAEAQA